MDGIMGSLGSSTVLLVTVLTMARCFYPYIPIHGRNQFQK